MPTESQLRDTAIRQRVHQLIENGRLPVMPPAQINAGYGSGCLCAACDQQISRLPWFQPDRTAYWQALPLP
jgi:hypothetical protein